MSAREDNTRQDGLRDLIETYEGDLITDALKITLGNQSHAAGLFFQISILSQMSLFPQPLFGYLHSFLQ
jgi:hypothetical protein